jgi:hypothetical protein
MTHSNRDDMITSKIKHAIIDSNPPRCKWCDNVIAAPRRYKGNVMYCNDEHALRKQRERHNEREKEKQAIIGMLKLEEGEQRRGPVYQAVRDHLGDDEWNRWIDGDVKNQTLAIALGFSAQAVGRARKAAFNDRVMSVSAEVFEPDTRFADLLGPPDLEMAELLAEEPDVFEKRLSELVDAFVEWRTEFFRVGFETTYITKPVHKRWIRTTLHTIYTGGRSLILSPPRHGKTDLLIHFCVWLICRNPNIRILWVGPNGDIAENCLGQVRDLLESHVDLQKAYLAPGQHWAPQTRAASLWQRQRFTVANRTLTLKQPTMWSTGVGGKILSLDCDFIIVDDPADPDASQTPGGRDKIEKWFKIKLITRKMHHTGLAMISSRVHPEDLYSEFVDSERWSVVIDKAHDQSICGLKLWDHHKDDQACVLFPEINPLIYLRDQQDDVGDALFEMMYLNQPRPEGTMIFDIDQIRDVCLDNSRGIGINEISGKYRLVAGLDPASRGVQAAFLWAVQLGADQDSHSHRMKKAVYHMVDLETQRAGGPDGAHRVMREWFEKYGVALWVVEDNAYQSVFFGDPRTRAVEVELGLDIKPTTTGKNKHDPDFGVAGMAPLFHEGQVILPYAAGEARRKTDQYLRQLSNFTGETVGVIKRKHLSDILMASWFPHATVIKKWRREERREKVQQSQTASFSDYNQATYNQSPWGEVQYPGQNG